MYGEGDEDYEQKKKANELEMLEKRRNDKDYPECPVCMGLMTEPCKLPCNHILCKNCVLLIMKEYTQQRRCPLDRKGIPGNFVPKIDVNMRLKIKMKYPE